MKIVISPAAKKDIENAIDFYKKQREGFGVIFKNELKNKINNLKIVPTSGSFLYNSVRYRVLDKFPYIIVYEFEPTNNLISIYRIFHTSQQPYWNY